MIFLDFCTGTLVNSSVTLRVLLYIWVTRSRKIESDRDYQKKRNVFKNLKFCGERKNCTLQLTGILKRLTLTRLQAFTSQIVTFKILTQVPISVWITTPFVKHTYFLEQTCSVISNSFISFFKQTLLPWHVPYIFITPLLISQAHFFCFCNTCSLLKFRNSSDVARRNIFYYIALWLQSPFATLHRNLPVCVYLPILYSLWSFKCCQ